MRLSHALNQLDVGQAFVVQLGHRQAECLEVFTGFAALLNSLQPLLTDRGDRLGHGLKGNTRLACKHLKALHVVCADVELLREVANGVGRLDHLGSKGPDCGHR